MNEFRHMSNIRLVAIVMLNGMFLLMRSMVIYLIVDYLVPNTSTLLSWVEFTVYITLHTLVVLAFQHKLFLQFHDAVEELVRRMVRAIRA